MIKMDTKQFEIKKTINLKEGGVDYPEFNIFLYYFLEQPHKTLEVDEEDYLKIIYKGEPLGLCDGVQDSNFIINCSEDFIIIIDGVNFELYFMENIDKFIFIKNYNDGDD